MWMGRSSSNSMLHKAALGKQQACVPYRHPQRPHPSGQPHRPPSRGLSWPPQQHAQQRKQQDPCKRVCFPALPQPQQVAPGYPNRYLFSTEEPGGGLSSHHGIRTNAGLREGLLAAPRSQLAWSYQGTRATARVAVTYRARPSLPLQYFSGRLRNRQHISEWDWGLPQHRMRLALERREEQGGVVLVAWEQMWRHRQLQRQGRGGGPADPDGWRGRSRRGFWCRAPHTRWMVSTT